MCDMGYQIPWEGGEQRELKLPLLEGIFYEIRA